MMNVSVSSGRGVDKLIILLILLCHFEFALSHPHRIILYVMTHNGSCQNPSNAEVYTTCHTFDWYYKNFSFWCKENTEMLFEEGVHFLDTFINVSDCYNFTMSGMGSTSNIGSGLPQPSSQIKCSSVILSTGLYFTNSTSIRIQNLEFESCGGAPFLNLKKVQLTSSLAFNSVHDMNFDHVVITNASGYALITRNIFGSNTIVDSAFLYPKGHPCSKESGNARILFFLTRATHLSS